MQHTEQLLKLINDLKDISGANTRHVAVLDVILGGLITTLDETTKQSLLINLKRYSEAVQHHPELASTIDAALQHVSGLLATPPDKPRPMLQIIRGGKSDS